MFCGNCGTKMSEEDAFCSRCGSPIPKSDVTEDQSEDTLYSPNDTDDDDDDAIHIILTDETGEENRFEFLDLISYRNRKYVVLLSEDEAESDTVTILEVKNADTDYESYVPVGDQRILEKVFALFKEENKEYYNFVD